MNGDALAAELRRAGYHAVVSAGSVYIVDRRQRAGPWVVDAGAGELVDRITGRTWPVDASEAESVLAALIAALGA